MNEYGFRYFASRNSDAAAVIDRHGATSVARRSADLVDGIARVSRLPASHRAMSWPSSRQTARNTLAAYLAGIAAASMSFP
jgi:hypothetical protein